MNKELIGYVKKNYKTQTVVEMANATNQKATTIRKTLQSQGLLPKRALNTLYTTDVITQAVAEQWPMEKVMSKTKMSAQSVRLRMQRLDIDIPEQWQPREHGKSLVKRIEARMGRMIKPSERLLYVDGNKRSKDIDNVVVLPSKKHLLKAHASLKDAAYAAVRAGVITYNTKTGAYEFTEARK